MPKKKPHKYDPKVLEAMQASGAAASAADEAIGLAGKTGNVQLEALKAGLEWLAQTTGVPGEWLAEFLEKEAGTNKAGAKALVHSASIGLLGDKNLGSVAANLAKDPEVQALARRVKAEGAKAGVLGTATTLPPTTAGAPEKPVAVQGKRPKGKKMLPVKPDATGAEVPPPTAPEAPKKPGLPASRGVGAAWQERAVAQQKARGQISKAIVKAQQESPEGAKILAEMKAGKTAASKARGQTWAGVQTWIKRMKKGTAGRLASTAEARGSAREMAAWVQKDAVEAAAKGKEAAEAATKGGLLKKAAKSPLTKWLGGIFGAIQVAGSLKGAEQTRAIRDLPVVTADEIQRREQERLLLSQRKAKLIQDPELTKKLIGVLTGAPQTNLTPSEVLIGQVPKPMSFEQEDAVLTGFLAQLDEAGQNRLLRSRAEEELGL